MSKRVENVHIVTQCFYGVREDRNKCDLVLINQKGINPLTPKKVLLPYVLQNNLNLENQNKWFNLYEIKKKCSIYS